MPVIFLGSLFIKVVIKCECEKVTVCVLVILYDSENMIVLRQAARNYLAYTWLSL